MLFQSILKKDIVYFDNNKTGELNSLLTDDVNKIRDGIGDKFGSIIYTISNVISAVIIGRLLHSIEASIKRQFINQFIM
jgi:ABC-type multidrug transport system fused ATPase/permease subunit